LRLVLSIPNWRPAVDLETGQAIESDRYLDVLFGRDQSKFSRFNMPILTSAIIEAISFKKYFFYI